MDERCRACRNVCKQIEAGEEPTHYEVSGFTPNQALKLVEIAMRTYYGARHIEVTRSVGSVGHQMAILCETFRGGVRGDDQILLLAQAGTTLNGSTEIWFRYGVPEACCDRPETVDEFSDMVKDAMAVVFDNDARVKTH